MSYWFDINFIIKLKISIKIRRFVDESETLSNAELMVEKKYEELFYEMVDCIIREIENRFLKISYKNLKTLTNIILNPNMKGIFYRGFKYL